MCLAEGCTRKECKAHYCKSCKIKNSIHRSSHCPAHILEPGSEIYNIVNIKPKTQKSKSNHIYMWNWLFNQKII